jgi:hypothetical protein
MNKLKYNLSIHLNRALKKSDSFKSFKTKELIGIELKQFKEYLEKKFKTNMTWDNYGDWHLDHIVPVQHFIDNFDFSKKDVQQIAYHYSNFQPLWAKENISKSDNISKEFAEKKINEIKALIKK